MSLLEAKKKLLEKAIEELYKEIDKLEEQLNFVNGRLAKMKEDN